MKKVKSYGLIDKDGNVIRGSNDFTVQQKNPGVYILEFRRNVHNKAVVATARNLNYCDSSGTTMEVCNYQDEKRKLGFHFRDESLILGFSFMLV